MHGRFTRRAYACATRLSDSEIVHLLSVLLEQVLLGWGWRRLLARVTLLGVLGKNVCIVYQLYSLQFSHTPRRAPGAISRVRPHVPLATPKWLPRNRHPPATWCVTSEVDAISGEVLLDGLNARRCSSTVTRKKQIALVFAEKMYEDSEMQPTTATTTEEMKTKAVVRHKCG